jgi:hypothetical protein
MALSYVYFHEHGRRSVARVFTRDEARCKLLPLEQNRTKSAELIREASGTIASDPLKFCFHTSYLLAENGASISAS